MSIKETTQILAVLKVAFPNSYSKLDESDIIATVNLWNMQFQDFDYQTVSNAVNAIIATRTNSYSPTIGEIKEKIYEMYSGEKITAKEAWDYIVNALPRCSYYSHQEWEKLPEAVKKTVSPSQLKAWATDSNFNYGVESSNYIKAFNTMSVFEKNQIMLPQSVRNALPENNNKMLEVEQDG